MSFAEQKAGNLKSARIIVVHHEPRPTRAPFYPQLSPRWISVAQGAAVAYLIAAGGGIVGGALCSMEGSGALVEAGMVVVLKKVAATKFPASQEQNGEERTNSGRALICRHA